MIVGKKITIFYNSGNAKYEQQKKNDIIIIIITIILVIITLIT
jgi:hypothetical protein